MKPESDESFKFQQAKARNLRRNRPLTEECQLHECFALHGGSDYLRRHAQISIRA